MTTPAEELREVCRLLSQWAPDLMTHTPVLFRKLDALLQLSGQQPRETGHKAAGEPHRASDGSTDADTAPRAAQRRTAAPAEHCGQKAGVVVLPHPPHKFMRGARLYQCPGNDTPDAIEIINPRNTGWYWHCTTCGAEAGKFTAESSARAAARTEHPQCPPDPDGPYAWTIPADQPDPDLNSLRQEIYTRLNRAAEFVGCPSATADDIVRLVRAWHEPSCDSHDTSVDSHDASVDSTDAHHFRDTAKVIKDAEPAPDCNARDEPDSQHNPDLCTPTCWRTRHARYTTALIAAYTGPPTGRTDRMAVAAMDLADHETQQLRLQLGLVRSAAQRATENLKQKAERQAAERKQLHGLLAEAVDWIEEGDLRDRMVTALNAQSGPKVRDKDQELRDANEHIERLTAELKEARMWARHGYEIGQRHCGWTDYGVAPAWLTDGWPPHIDSCEHLRQLTHMEAAIARVHDLADRWKRNGTSDLKRYADIILDGLNEPPSPAATQATEQQAMRVYGIEMLGRIADEANEKVALLRDQIDNARTTCRITATLARDSEATVQRVIALHERWVKAGPPIGISMTGYFQWWREHLAELHDTILTPGDQPARQENAVPAWTPPPPGDTREQLPDHILALIRPYLRGYTSTACQTAGYLASAAVAQPEHRAELTEWRRRMRKRCRRNQKYTGEICPHHTKETTP